MLVEGYKTSDLPKIEIHRARLDKPLLGRSDDHDPNLMAVASDSAAGLAGLDVPVLDLDDTEALADFLVESQLKNRPDS